MLTGCCIVHCLPLDSVDCGTCSSRRVRWGRISDELGQKEVVVTWEVDGCDMIGFICVVVELCFVEGKRMSVKLYPQIACMSLGSSGALGEVSDLSPGCLMGICTSDRTHRCRAAQVSFIVVVRLSCLIVWGKRRSVGRSVVNACRCRFDERERGQNFGFPARILRPSEKKGWNELAQGCALCNHFGGLWVGWMKNYAPHPLFLQE